MASPSSLGGDEWRLYDFVARHFISTVSADCKLQKTEVQLKIGTETFWCSGSKIFMMKIYVIGRKMITPGFTEISKWNVSSSPEAQLPEFEKVKQVPIVEVFVTL